MEEHRMKPRLIIFKRKFAYLPKRVRSGEKIWLSSYYSLQQPIGLANYNITPEEYLIEMVRGNITTDGVPIAYVDYNADLLDSFMD